MINREIIGVVQNYPIIFDTAAGAKGVAGSSEEAMASLKEQAKDKRAGDTVSAAFDENGQVKVYTASVNESGIGLVSVRNATAAEKAVLQGNAKTLANATNETAAREIQNKSLSKAEIPEAKVDEILKTPKYSRPDPTTYLKKDYIANHKAQFKDGVTKISYQAPTGYAGPPGGTFVMPSSVADDLIAKSRGDISELEQLLGIDLGDLGTNPVRIDIAKPYGLRMPSGNEKGANSKWVPGGYTSGGIPEMVIDSPGPGQYIIKPIK